MEFLYFLGIGIVVAVVVRYVILLLLVPVGLLVGVALQYAENKTGAWYGPGMALLLICDVYIITAWAAFCAAYTHVFLDARTLSWPFIYWLTGILIATGPVASIKFQDCHEPNLQNTITVILSPLSFILFAVFPVLMVYVHGWWLLWLLMVLS